jgi:hypothetical protein
MWPDAPDEYNEPIGLTVALSIVIAMGVTILACIPLLFIK